jgi:hypothetical protein
MKWFWFAAAAAAGWIASRMMARPQPAAQSAQQAAPLQQAAFGAQFGGGWSAPAIDLSSMTSAIAMLAKAPNIQTYQGTVPAGTTEIIPPIGGKRACIMAFSATCAGASVIRFQSQGKPLWTLGLDVAAGKSGANLSTAWPAYLFASAAGGNLEVKTDQSAEISVAYWQENA